MKVLAVLGKLKNGQTVLVTDNKCQPFVAVNSYNPEDGTWSGGHYCSNLATISRYVMNIEPVIGYDRALEISGSAIDAMLEDGDGKATTVEWAHGDIDMQEHEMQWYGLDAVEDELEARA